MQENNLDNLIITFSEKMQQMKASLDSLKKMYNFFEAFFPNDKKEQINKINDSITNLENTKLDDFDENNKNLFDLGEFKKEAEEGEKLKNSLFFMEIYNYDKKIKVNLIVIKMQ